MDAIDIFDVSFSTNNSLYNVVSKAVLLDLSAEEILRNYIIGNDLDIIFVNENLCKERKRCFSLSTFQNKELEEFKGELNKTMKLVQGKVERRKITPFKIPNNFKKTP